ncbi:MAG: amidohydrolase family protein, partial [Bdellovibrionaceae bacterium]|nr:amidohydrolase family protein [Pseudobdellovibrionaceae bacterium]
LNHDGELKQLSVANSLKGARIVPTFLGAHAVPPDYQSPEEFLDFLARLLPLIKRRRLAHRVDIFVEKGFFSASQARRYLELAKQNGFSLAIHADQLSHSGGTDLAVDMGALSADHVICVDDRVIQKLAKSSVTAVLLPVADVYMKCPFPPARKIIEAGGRVALATDFNPGSCPSLNVGLVGLIARLEMKMSLPEVISAYTVGGAAALGMQNQVGALLPGLFADFICIEGDWTQLFYELNTPQVCQVYVGGRKVYSRPSKTRRVE